MAVMRYSGSLVVALALGALTTDFCPALGQDASRWAGEAHSQVRLIAGANGPRQALLRAGVDIKLAPGWKTYWRYPGDSGVPPQFDFSASTNVESVRVLWPAPERMVDGGGQSIGYHGRVIMPLQVVRVDPAKPALLDLKLDYAVCEKLCVPAHAAVQLQLAPAPSAHDDLLVASEARVPKPAAMGDAGPIAIRKVRRDGTSEKPQVAVEVAAPKDVPVDLFVEGPTAAWALPLPEPQTPTAGGLRQFSFALDGLPAGAQAKGAELTFTLVAGAQAIEVKTRLD
jgi:DsbC/DsbD-like thiol-disulfide interchange protein